VFASYFCDLGVCNKDEHHLNVENLVVAFQLPAWICLLNSGEKETHSLGLDGHGHDNGHNHEHTS